MLTCWRVKMAVVRQSAGSSSQMKDFSKKEDSSIMLC